MGAGRPSRELTEEERAEILDLTARGFSVRFVCDKIGISTRTFYKKIEEDEGLVKQYQGAREEALKALKSVAEQCVASKMEGNDSDAWRAAAWFLSHKHPAEYAEKRILDQSMRQESPFEVILNLLDEGTEDEDND